MTTTHLVIGAGPVGTTVALQLAEAGTPVRLLTRGGGGPVHPLVERVRGDATDRAVLATHAEGAAAVHLCAHGSRYDADTWRRELPGLEAAVMDTAVAVGAVVVFPESLYSYGPVRGAITEDHPRDAVGGKPGVRAELLRARAAHRAATVSVAASDFLGPHVRTAHAGERMVPTVLAGRTLRVLGSLDQPHSFTYVPDLAAAMVRVASDETLWGAVWHAPTAAPVTQRQLIHDLAEAAGVPAPPLGALPTWVLRGAGLFSPEARGMVDVGYQFDRPFVVDSARSEQRLGLAPTPWAEAIATTVAWWREETRVAQSA